MDAWSDAMKMHGLLIRCTLLAATLGLLATSSGCQTTMGGQTLPSAHYLTDDIQYFPPGDEFLLPEQVRAIEEYRALEAGLNGGDEFGAIPAVPGGGAF